MIRSLLLSVCIAATAVVPAPVSASQHLRCQLLVVGGTESGWAAAIQAARMGVESIVIVHDGKWLGGQFTEQALACVDENKGVGKVGWGVDWHPMKRSFHRSGLFRELMDGIEAFNTTKYGDPMPGRPYHGPSTFRPVEAEQIFRQLLQPYIDSGQVSLFLNRYPVAAEVDASGEQPRLTGLSFAPLGDQQADLLVDAVLTIDASDWGEAIQLSGAAFECGPDPKSRYGEPSAPEDLSGNPAAEMNPITWAMIVERGRNKDARPIERPSRFDDRHFVRTSRISLSNLGKLAWDRPVQLGSILHWPARGKQVPRQLSVYNVRRLIEGSTSRDGRTVVLLNYMLGQDYPLERLPGHVVRSLEQTEPGGSEKNIVTMTRRQREIVYADARRHSLALLYHLQNYVHQRAEDKANSFAHFELSDEFGTPDRLPPKPYIRESLRLKAMYMMREQDGRNRDGESKNAARECFAQVLYPDGVFCWQFHYDFHRTGRAYLEDEGRDGPWIDYEKPGRHTHHVSDRSVFPLRSLIPEEVDGLIGAQKNVGYSSIVCAAIRLHDQCVAIGQAAGATAAVAIQNRVAPRQIPFDRDQLEQVRHGLCRESDADALLLFPYRDLSPDHSAFVAVNRLAARGIVRGESTEVDFRPDDEAGLAWQREMLRLATRDSISELTVPIEKGSTRGDFCRALWRRLEQAAPRPYHRKLAGDADGDGIADRDDPNPMTPGPPVVWSVRPAEPEEDGIPELPTPNRDGTAATWFDFGPSAAKQHESEAIRETGVRYDASTAFGWSTDMTDQRRVRGQRRGEACDTFVFTRDRARWECDVVNGSWRVTVCVGDASHDQPGQRVTVEGQPLIDGVTTAAGRFCERSRIVEVSDGRITIDLGPQTPGCNTCLNWLMIQPAP